MASRRGPRSEALRSRRAKSRRRTLTAGTALAVVAALVVAGAAAYLAGDDDSAPATAAPTPTPQGEDPVISTLFFGTKGDGRSAIWMTLVAYDTSENSGAVVYIPAHAAVEVPGRGLQGVGDALGSGGVPLLVVSTENLLGMKIDNYVELSDQDARTLFEATGPISVDVPAEVRVAVGRDRARLIFTEGPQRLGPAFLADLLYVRGLDSDDVELGSRHLAFWDGLLDAFEDEPENLAAAVRAASGAMAQSSGEVTQQARLLGALAGLDPASRTLTMLPVEQVSVGGSELYSVDQEEVRALLSGILSGVRPAGAETKVQVLNGNGVPGIGQEIAERLIGAGFRVVLTGNAPRLNYERTLVVTYDDSPEAQAAAERARDLIGVGTVQVSAQQQGIVDLTIVIGKDYLRTR